MTRTPADDRRLELGDGRTIRYATWGDAEGTPVFIGHGTPGSRLALAPGLDNPEWIYQQRLLFVGVDRPGYGYSDPWATASLLDSCAGGLVRVADALGLERFAALGFSGGAPYVLALGVLVPERLRGVAVVSGLGMLDRPGALEVMSEADVEDTKMAREAPDELATARGEAARTIHEDPEFIFAGLSEELPEVDRRALERPEVRAFLIETFREAVRQGATGWIDDELRQVRPWPFRLEEISGVDVHLHHGEADTLVPAHHAKHLAKGIAHYVVEQVRPVSKPGAAFEQVERAVTRHVQRDDQPSRLAPKSEEQRQPTHSTDFMPLFPCLFCHTPTLQQLPSPRRYDKLYEERFLSREPPNPRRFTH